MLYCNANGISNKINELKNCISLYGVDIVCVNETHLNCAIKDAEISIPGFVFYRQDRDFNIDEGRDSKAASGGGGSVIYVREVVGSSKIDTFVAPDSVAVEVKTNIGLVNIACVYRSQSLNEAQLKCINYSLEQLSKINEESIVVGDFNLTEVNWITGSVSAPPETSNKSLLNQIRFMEGIHNNGYTWFITDEVTRRRMFNGIVQESTLDQILSTNEAAINDFNVVSKLGKSDHLCILAELNMKHETAGAVNQQKTVRSWSKVTTEELLESASKIDWQFQCDRTSSEIMWNELASKLEIVSQTVPLKKKTCQPWSSSRLKRYRREKDKAWANFDSNPTTENFSIAHEADNKYTRQEWSAMIKYEKKITTSLKENSKPLYTYLRSKRILKTSVGSLTKPDGTLTKSNEDTAEVLADAFSSVFVEEPEGPLQEECYKIHDQHTEEIGDLNISVSEVAQELKAIDISKCQGPDNIHPKLLKSLSSTIEFVSALTEMFNVCISTGKIPSSWKDANVVGLFKKGNKKDALNYRPVSLTSLVCKVYEKFIHRHILQHVEPKISSRQHGFIHGKSCFSNLLESAEEIMGLLEGGSPVDVLYMDFWKAFDSVPHFRLLTKLENMGITGKTLEMIRDFLTGRSLRVCVGGESSSIRYVLSGVPQGSVLGPLLFVIFINDLPDCLNSCSKLFADDLKLIVDANDIDEVNTDLKALENWEQKWLLKFNPEKCKVLHLDFNGNPNNQYALNNVVMDNTDKKDKDLGIVPDPKLQWTDQVKNSISKAISMIAWITRNVISREQKLMLNIYKVIIRPHLEYCVQIWSPEAKHGNWGLILEMESVQRRFTRLIDGIGLLPYSERLERLGLTTLAERRLRGDLIETFKILNGLVTYGQNCFNRSRYGLKLINGTSITSDNSINNLLKSFMPNRIIKYWNLLPNNVKMSADVNSFKENLDIYKEDNSNLLDRGNYWEISHEVLNKIEGPNYARNKSVQNFYLLANPKVAKRKGINIY